MSRELSSGPSYMSWPRTPVFKELWDQYRGTEVSEVVVRNFLTLDRREAGRAEFSDTAANDIVQAFKATIDYAGVSASDTLPDAGRRTAA